MPAARTMKEKMTMRREPLLPPLPPLPFMPEEASVKAAHEGDFGQVLGKIITIILRIMAGFVLVIAVMIALSVLLALPIGLITGNMVVGELNGLDIADFLRNYTFIPLWLIVTLLTLLIFLPLAGLIYLISKALFKFKTKSRLGLILTIAWLVTLFSLMGIGIYVASHHADDFPEGLLSDSYPYQVSEKRTFDPFTNLSVAGAFEIVAVPSDTNYMIIHAPEKLLPDISTKTGNGRMEIHMRKVRIKKWKKMRIDVHYSDWKSLEQLRLSGAVRFTCSDTLKAPALSVKLSGASDINIAVNNRRAEWEVSGASKITADIVAEKVSISISGAGKANLSGKSPYVGFKLSGASKIDAGDFAADTVSANLSGSSRISVHADKYLDIHASGASLIEYSGTPVTDISTSGASKVRRSN
ncbi:MAG: DUF2807 domain-containing protein, partial [Prevotellaceae bacterium]|jgi:hypothetical protein|nr:DUF2807 domain-containing protein [Prevotellaceae bacterium]